VAPPLVGLAVKVILPPVHTDGVAGLIETVGATVPLTVMVSELEVAVVVVAQVAFEVSTQVTTSPFTRVAEVKLTLSVPAFTLFTFH
jgi:hypothetical protein